MDTAEQHIKRLQTKLLLLAKYQRQLQKENQQLKQDIDSLKEQNRVYKHELSIVEMQNAMLKASQEHLSEKEKKEMDKKLQFYITEIDRCIALLSR